MSSAPQSHKQVGRSFQAASFWVLVRRTIQARFIASLRFDDISFFIKNFGNIGAQDITGSTKSTGHVIHVEAGPWCASTNKRGTAELWIKEGKQAVKMTRLSCHRFRSNQVRLWLSVINYSLGNLWRRSVLENIQEAGTRGGDWM